MSYLERIEAKVMEVDAAILKPVKFKSTQKKKKAFKGKDAEGTKENVGFSNLTNTNKLIPTIKKELQVTNPRDFTDESWIIFIKKLAPKLLTALFLDMNIVPNNRKAEFSRFLATRLKV